MTTSTILACEHLQKTFIDGESSVQVLKEIKFNISRGQTVGIVGASGSGKSTLLHLLGGLELASHGQVLWQGINIQTLSEKKRSELRNRSLGFVYQFHHLLPEFSALENVAMPLLIRNEKPANALEKAAILLDRVGLSERKSHLSTHLSGGERQRVAIARALVGDPLCVLADEPTGNLDEVTAEKTIDMMLELQQTMQTSFVIVTHNVALSKRLQKNYNLVNGVLTEISTNKRG